MQGTGLGPAGRPGSAGAPCGATACGPPPTPQTIQGAGSYVIPRDLLPSLRKLFVQQLEGLILSGELRPGDRLPTERELADEMKISKTVVHEGLRELHQLGFLKVESRKGLRWRITPKPAAWRPSWPSWITTAACRIKRLPPAFWICATTWKPPPCGSWRPTTPRRPGRPAGPAAKRRRRLRFPGWGRWPKRCCATTGGHLPQRQYHHPLIFNAFARVNLEFWSDYVRLEGIARSLHTLSRFTKLIEAGEGDAAAELLRQGLERFRAALYQ